MRRARNRYGAIWVCAWLASAAGAAFALPQEEIVQKLEPVTVFTLANRSGNLLVWRRSDRGRDSATANVFISPKDAQDVLNRLRKEDPELGKDFQVLPLSLAEVYRLREANKGKSEATQFSYVPPKEQVESAVSLLLLSGQKVRGFRGTPLFLARVGQDQRYLTVMQDKRPVVPLFFHKNELQELLRRYGKEKPELAAQIQIQVINLEGLLAALQIGEDPTLESVVLVPPRETVEYIKSLRAESGNAEAPPAASRTPPPAGQAPVAPAKPREEGFAPRPDPN